MEEQFEREERLSYDPFTVSDAFGPVGNFLLAVSRKMALTGGLIFVGLVLMSLVSVVGRRCHLRSDRPHPGAGGGLGHHEVRLPSELRRLDRPPGQQED